MHDTARTFYVYLISHGHSEGNRLTPKGAAQTAALAQRLNETLSLYPYNMVIGAGENQICTRQTATIMHTMLRTPTGNPLITHAELSLDHYDTSQKQLQKDFRRLQREIGNRSPTVEEALSRNFPYVQDAQTWISNFIRMIAGTSKVMLAFTDPMLVTLALPEDSSTFKMPFNAGHCSAVYYEIKNNGLSTRIRTAALIPCPPLKIR